MAKLLITGGVGFIGANAAAYFARQAHDVLLLDNFSRASGQHNLAWLKTEVPAVRSERCDLTKNSDVVNAVAQFEPDWVLHLGAQVAVTTSISSPRADFETNALGTLNILEAMRAHAPNAKLIYASTNKVYGGLAGVDLEEGDSKIFAPGLRGIAEDFPLDFYSPYGCSKGAADQYVIDYGRIYNLDTISIRQSCIYGPRQFGMEDQGWLAWFALRALRGEPATIFGSGKQVRDVLHVDDLLRLYQAIFETGNPKPPVINAGGGLDNSLSLLEYVELLAEDFGLVLRTESDAARPGDQLWYVSDNSRAHKSFDWSPEIGISEGVGSLVDWAKGISKGI